MTNNTQSLFLCSLQLKGKFLTQSYINSFFKCIILFFSSLFLSSAVASNAHYEVPDQLNDGIPTGHLSEAGIAIEPITRLLEKTYSQEYKELHSLLIYKDGLLVLEEYYFGNNDVIQFEQGIIRNRSRPPIQWSRDKKHYVASVNKALTATLTGIALKQNNLNTDHKMSDLLPAGYKGWFKDANKATLTIGDVLRMQMGFTWDEWESDDLVQLWQSNDFTRFVLDRPNVGPGTQWRYNSAGPNMLLRGLDQLLEQPLRKWAEENFYSKLGITDYDWQSQPDGYPEGSAKMFMRPRDMLKVGISYLNQGRWQGQQLIPAQWVADAFTVQATSDAGDYSYLMWLREIDGTYYLSADGDGGQYINIFPKENMVIVMTGGNYLEWPIYSKQADNIMSEYVLPALRHKVKHSLSRRP